MIETTVMNVSNISGNIKTTKTGCNWLELKVECTNYKGEKVSYALAFCFKEGVSPKINLSSGE
tara:strand:- start:584 stop:772 length:189 start_codon:yes stop_codon:yes gene_type:complete